MRRSGAAPLPVPNRIPGRHGYARGSGLILLLIFTLGALAGCGFDAPTLQPSTQSDGINITLGDASRQSVKIRNLMIIADANGGKGFLSASLMGTGAEDQLRSASLVPLKTNYEPAGAAQALQLGSIMISPTRLTVLTDLPAIWITHPAIIPGGVAEITLVFAIAGQIKARIPITSNTDPAYAQVTPKPGK